MCSSISTTFDSPYYLGGPAAVVWCWCVHPPAFRHPKLVNEPLADFTPSNPIQFNLGDYFNSIPFDPFDSIPLAMLLLIRFDSNLYNVLVMVQDSRRYYVFHTRLFHR
jgi:hypothetical protein